MSSLEAHEKRLESPFKNDIENAFQSKINKRSQKSKEDGGKSIENPGNKENQEKQTKNNGKFPLCAYAKEKVT